MRTFKILLGLFAVLAFSAVAVATASAAETLWKFLPGAAKTTGTGSSGAAILRAKGEAAVECTKSTTKSAELTEPATDATLILAIIVFEGCKAGGLFTATGLGDTTGNITTHVEGHTCLIGPNHFGIIFKPLPVHFEVPAIARLVLVEGAAIGLVEVLPTDLKHWELNLNAKEKGPSQEIEKCEGGVKMTLTSKINEGEPLESSEEVQKGLLTFASAQDPT